MRVISVLTGSYNFNWFTVVVSMLCSLCYMHTRQSLQEKPTCSLVQLLSPEANSSLLVFEPNVLYVCP
jgi:hypothetical protein